MPTPQQCKVTQGATIPRRIYQYHLQGPLANGHPVVSLFLQQKRGLPHWHTALGFRSSAAALLYAIAVQQCQSRPPKPVPSPNYIRDTAAVFMYNPQTKIYQIKVANRPSVCLHTDLGGTRPTSNTRFTHESRVSTLLSRPKNSYSIRAPRLYWKNCTQVYIIVIKIGTFSETSASHHR